MAEGGGHCAQCTCFSLTFIHIDKLFNDNDYSVTLTVYARRGIGAAWNAQRGISPANPWHSGIKQAEQRRRALRYVSDMLNTNAAGTEMV